MLSQQALDRIQGIRDGGLQFSFADPEAFNTMVSAAGEIQKTNRPYVLPDGLSDKAVFTVTETDKETPYVEVVPAAGLELSSLVLIYYHGGGFIHDLNPVTLNLCARLAAELGCRVLVSLYPCLPSATCDETFEEAFDLYRQARISYPDAAIALMGDSAGGTLTIAVAMMARDRGLIQPTLLVPCSPFVDMTGITEHQPEHQDDKVDDDPLLHWYGCDRIVEIWGAPYDKQSYPPDPFFGAKDSLAPMLIFAGGREIFKAGIRAFANQVKAEGGDVELIIGDGLWHAFFLDQGTNIPEVEALLDRLLPRLKALA